MTDFPHPHGIAILGATGKTGREVLRCLLENDTTTLRIHIYVRSQAKLLSIFPEITSNANIQIWEGSITDVELIKGCLAGVEKIVCTLGENDNRRGVHILQDASNSIIAALDGLRIGKLEGQKPHLIFLSSSTYNARFAAARPPFVHWLIKTAFSYPYADLLAAQNRLLESRSLFSVLLVQPPLLIEEEGSGYEISTESVRLAVSYEDLGRAFAEMAINDEYRKLDAVGVSSRLGDRHLRYAPEILRRICRGLWMGVIGA